MGIVSLKMLIVFCLEESGFLVARFRLDASRRQRLENLGRMIYTLESSDTRRRPSGTRRRLKMRREKNLQ
jgi:hypothetical protein